MVFAPHEVMLDEAFTPTHRSFAGLIHTIEFTS